MKYYDLGENEVVLYKGYVKVDNNDIIQLILTNINFVFVKQLQFDNDQTSVNVFPVNEVKIYNGIPQILKKGNVIELYFLHNEIEFTFESGVECRKFVDVALKEITHKNKFERMVEKTNSAIHCVDNSLGIDSVGAVKSAVKFAIESKSAVGKTIGTIKGIGFGKKK